MVETAIENKNNEAINFDVLTYKDIKILTRKIILPFQSVGSNIKENIINILEQESYNKCSKEGYIKTSEAVSLFI